MRTDIQSPFVIVEVKHRFFQPMAKAMQMSIGTKNPFGLSEFMRGLFLVRTRWSVKEEGKQESV